MPMVMAMIWTLIDENEYWYPVGSIPSIASAADGSLRLEYVVLGGDMAERRGADLAARIRAQIETKKSAEAVREADKKAREADGRRERKRLLADLLAFGQEIGHFEVTREKDVLILGLGDKQLRFEASGIADRVRVVGLDPEPRLFLHPELNRWVIAHAGRGGIEEQELLFDAGLERLMAEAFALG
jgi:hypothetical protein